MYYLEDENYIPLLAVTYSIVSEDVKQIKELFESNVKNLSLEQLKKIFLPHSFCQSLTAEEFVKYQYFYGACLIGKIQNNSGIDIQIEKMYRERFPDIYKLVRKNSKFNIMDYYFLYNEADGLTVKDKLLFSNRAVALMFFVFNKWGNSDKQAHGFGIALYDILMSDKKANFFRREKTDIIEIRQKKEEISIGLLNDENIEMCFDKLYGMYSMAFDKIYAEFGEDNEIIQRMIEIKKMTSEHINDLPYLMDFFTFNISVLMTMIRRYMDCFNNGEWYLYKYLNDKQSHVIDDLNKKIETDELKQKKCVEELHRQIYKLQNEIINRDEKIDRLGQELREKKDMLKETSALRSYVYNLHQVEKDTFADESNEKWEQLNEKKGIIIGGSETWQMKMKKKLPSWRFIGSSVNNIDKNMIGGNEIVFINVSYIGHSLYYSVVSIVQNLDIKLGYINNHNSDRVLDELVKQVL